MSIEDTLRDEWMDARTRLDARGLLASAGAQLSVRLPGGDAMWFGTASDDGPRRAALAGSAGDMATHAAIYRQRADVGAIASGGGRFGRALADFGGVLPIVFDEQARHIGSMGEAIADVSALAHSLKEGGNALLIAGTPVCLGITCRRMVLNAELFEKCAKAWVLATATGHTVKPLPWWVRAVAGKRLLKDERRAAERFAQGRLPEESRGY